MRILNVSPRYAPARGGAEHHLEAICRRQAAAGHQVTVLTTDALDFELFWQPGLGRIALHEERVDGVRVLRFPVQHLPGTPLAYDALRRALWLLSRVPGTVPLASRLAQLTPRVPALRRWLAATDEPFDLVVGVNICYEMFLGVAATFARRHNLPLVIHPFTHLGAGTAPGTDAISQFYTMRHQIALVRQACAGVMMSPAERDFYVNKGLPAESLPVIGSGVEPGDVSDGNGARGRERLGVDGPLLLALGTLSPDKGSSQTVDAVRSLWRTGRAVDLVLAGTVTPAFAAYLDGLPATERERLHVLGRVDDDARKDLLAACDVLVMPSRADSFGIVFLEAWLNGKPVIAADTWGIRDGIVTPGQDGLLVPFGDARALADAIASLLDRPDAAREMGRRGKEKTVREHTWARKMEAVDALYETLMERSRS